MSSEEPRHHEPSASRRGPLAWMATNSVASNLLMLVLMIGGLVMMSRVKQEVFPEVELDTVIVNVVYPGASPAEVEQGVVLAVEEAVRGLEGVKDVRSTATEGVSVVAIELLLGTDPDRALADVKSAVDRITSFPEDIERPIISLASSRRQVVSLVLYGDADEHSLRRLGNRARDELLDDPHITYVDVTGIRPLEIGVEVPQEKLRAYHLTLDQIAQRIRMASVEVPAGAVKTRSGEVLLRTTERRDAGGEYGDVVLLSRPDGTELRVRDIATVRDHFRDVDREAFYDGKRAVMVNVYRVGDETPIEISDAVRSHVEQLKTRLPPGVDVAIWNDSSEIYRDRVELLLKNAYIGLALVLLVLGLFLQPVLAFWVTLGIPISFLGAIFFLPAADVSINMISLFAFIVTLGIVVDDAIVVGEAVYTWRQRGKDWMDAAIMGVREVAAPVVFAVLTTCIAFMPLLFVPGVSGKFFRNIPIVVIIVLLISLVECLVVLPAHVGHPIGRRTKIVLAPFLFVMSLLQHERVGRLLERFVAKAYRPSVGFAVRWRYLTIATGIAMLVAVFGFVAGGRMKFTFMPKVESDIITASLEMPVGTPVEVTREVSRRLTEAARGVAAEASGERSVLRGLYAEVGAATGIARGPSSAIDSAGGHLATVIMYLVPSGERAVGAAELARRWRERVGEIPGVDTLRFEFSTGAGGGPAITMRLTHPDMQTLEAAAGQLADELRSYEGVHDVDDGFSQGKEQLDFTLKPAARAHGITEIELARQVRNAFFGAEAVRQQRGRDELRVYVRLPEAERRSLHHVEQLVLTTPEGGEIPLAQAAEVERGRAYTTISRTDGRRTVEVTADVVGTTNANEVVASAAATVLPRLKADFPGLEYEPGGDQQRQAETMSSLGNGFTLALIAMFALLAIPFRSYVQPLIVMAAIPFGMVGALLGHILMGYDLSLMSMMGIVALSGVAVNDSLVLIVAINELRRNEGLGLLEAIVAGGARRFRPILLTSLTTFFGLTPMILETSVQARFLIPMAISLGFGVLFATFVTLMLVPSLYYVLEDVKALLGRVGFRSSRGEGAPAST